MERWHDYLGSDRGFEPAEHLAALVGEGLDIAAALQRRRDARKTELILALDVMEGVREYITDAKRIGLRLGVASSSSRAWVTGHLERLGIHQHWAAIRTRDDVERTKPAPDLVLAAQEKAGAGRAVMVGDTPWDVEAARKASIPAICVLTGGFARAELEEAGAAAVFEGAEELARRLEAALAAA